MIAQLRQAVRTWFRPAATHSAVPASLAPTPVPTALPMLRPSLSQLAQRDQSEWPLFVRESAAACTYIDLLGGLDWAHFPERGLGEKRRGPHPKADAPVVAAFLVKLDKGFESMKDLHDYLVEQPALVWVLGFALVPSDHYCYGFDVRQSLPTHRHLSRLLRKLPNAQMQFLLKGTLHLLKAELPAELRFGEEISLDTKQIIA